MRQIICKLKTGDIELEQVPAPSVEPGCLLIETRRTLVSQGTEKMLVKFGKASLFQKARSQPARVKQVLAKMRTDGVIPTVEAVFNKLDEPLQLGYCNVGVVIGVGHDVIGFQVGDRVASNGPHADVVSVPQNLVAKIPDIVTDDAAAFTVIGAIGLQGIRLAKPELGETFVVIGLGLIGQITVQLLRASGCRVIGFDFDHAKVELARKNSIEAFVVGAECDVVKEVLRLTQGIGCDSVIITASSESSNVVCQAAQMSRKRGRIILVGVVGLNINRSDFYEKELTFQVSCSYGPGRYDDNYEEKGLDYPHAFVRWTENRNFQAVLEAIASGSLQVEPLISRRVPLNDYRIIYDNMDDGCLASIFVFSGRLQPPDINMKISQPVFESNSMLSTTVRLGECNFSKSDGIIAVIGAGNFTKMSVLPSVFSLKIPVKTIVSASGVSGTMLAKKYRIPFSSTNYSEVLTDQAVKGVIITTRHNLHSAQTIAALTSGKSVLVEKPLCLKLAELKSIESVVNDVNGGPWVSVGFNRRFSPYAQEMRKLLGSASNPISVIATISAGAIPPDHWVHDPDVGGGRLIGEACHFIDFSIFLTGSLVESVSASLIGGRSDCASILLRHLNGSTSVVNYLANGNTDLSKERVEVHSDGRSLLLDNFRELRGFGFRCFRTLKNKQDKGHKSQYALFAQRIKSGGPALIPWKEISNSTRVTFAVQRAVTERRWVGVEEF
jgi:predicted dehydrogenase/threonine dehydrogenase-like Zn-dependent dehydrogenase